MLVNVLNSHSIDQSPKKQLLSSESMVTSDEANVLWIYWYLAIGYACIPKKMYSVFRLLPIKFDILIGVSIPYVLSLDAHLDR